MRCFKRISLFLLLPLLLSRIEVARAQAPDDAQTIFDAAVKEMAQKKYETACPKLKQVVEMRPDGVGAKLELAKCYEEWGKIASAWSVYTLAERQATQNNQKDRANNAAQKAASLKARLPTLTVEVPDKIRELQKFSLKRDGILIEQNEWGIPVPLDVGTYHLEAQAEGYMPWHEKVEIVQEGAAAKRVVTLEQIKALGPEKVKDPNAGSKPPKLQPQPERDPLPSPSGWQKPLGIIATALGGVGTTVGVIAIVSGVGKFNESNQEHCFETWDRCDSTGLALRDSAQSLVRGGFGVALGGVALATGGLVLWLSAPKPNPANKENKKNKNVARMAGSETRVGVHPGGIQIQGIF